MPKWILTLSGFFAVLEIMVSIMLLLSPGSVMEEADLNARGVDYLICMWAARQAALGVILGYATLMRSGPMLTICYIFLLVMFAGDGAIGIWRGETTLIMAALAMCALSLLALLAFRKRNRS